MKQLMLALTLSTFCFLAACETVPQTQPLRPDLDNPGRMVCETVPEARPAIPPAYVIDWRAVQTVEQARQEHEAYIASVLDRNRIVSGYIVLIEGRLFVCANNAQFWRDYWAGLPSGN